MFYTFKLQKLVHYQNDEIKKEDVEVTVCVCI